jgi:hypothetical protein
MIKLVVKTLKLGDVEDPEVYLGAAAYDWFQTEHGAWVKEHSTDMTYHQRIDHNTYGYAYYITATFSDPDAMIYKLKWSNNK